MNVDFSKEQIILIYGTFMKEIKMLEKMKNTPNCPIHIDSINAEIELFSSITNTLSSNFPGLTELDDSLSNIVNK